MFPKNSNLLRRKWINLGLLSACVCICARVRAGDTVPRSHEVPINVSELKVLKRDSGPINYYKVIDGPDGAYIHSAYKWPFKTTVLYYSIPDKLRGAVSKVRWRWRAVRLPKGGDECAAGRADSAAVLYLVWRRGLRWYSLKYVWSTVGIPGKVCDRKRSIFRVQETIIIESGESMSAWQTVELDTAFEFRKHFADGNPKADVPDIDGFGIMSDGDQTQSPSEADFGGFVITYL